MSVNVHPTISDTDQHSFSGTAQLNIGGTWALHGVHGFAFTFFSNLDLKS